MFASLKVESIKREHNLKTYREIVDFVEGKPVNKVKVDKKKQIIKNKFDSFNSLNQLYFSLFRNDCVWSII